MRPRYRDLQTLVLLAAVPDLEVQEPPVVLELFLLVLQLHYRRSDRAFTYDLGLLVAFVAHLYAVSAQFADLVLQPTDLGLLLLLELLLISLLLQSEQLLLDLQHVKLSHISLPAKLTR